MNRLDFVLGSAQFQQGFGHLLGITAGSEFGLLEQANATGEILDHFLASGSELELPPARFLQRGSFALQFLLNPFEFGKLVLRFADLGIDLFARRSPAALARRERERIASRGRRSFARGLKIVIDEL